MSVRLIHGDCIERLKDEPADSYDSCATDPPYGIGFMGREWDTFKPEAGEARIVPNRAMDSENPNLRGRVRGPASSPSAVEYDRSLEGQRAFQAWNELWAREVLRVLKPGAYAVVSGAPRSSHRMICGLEDAGFEVRDCFSWLFGQGFPKSLNLGDGRGTALKPAHEPIVLVRKPFKGTVAANLAKFGTGALNVDACRVDLRDEASASAARRGYGATIAPKEERNAESRFRTVQDDALYRSHAEADSLGRWPTNLLLTHSSGCNGTCVDDCPVRALDEQSGQSSETARVLHRSGERRMDGWGLASTSGGITHGDSGGASRFFPTFRWDPQLDNPFLYCPKADRGERDAGCEHLTGRARDESRDPEAPGANNPRNRGGQQRANHHPTVKPVALMRWLCRLITPPQGRILEPFCGSGTTPVAAQLEDFDCTAIEREAEYIEIARARTSAYAPLFALETAP